MNMLEKINKSGVIKIIGKKLIVWDFSTYLARKIYNKLAKKYNLSKNKISTSSPFSRVSQFHKVILKKYPVLGTFLSFLVKVGYNFISDLLRYQSK
ncbi:hypothetical protein, partial [Mesomycoplasma ovipneumoniae]|uniref:hypothetical protein n=1 Tax=Mesomycoplasma ovipneumoniae TaxID=29562 RepID=UPI00308009F2